MGKAKPTQEVTKTAQEASHTTSSTRVDRSEEVALWNDIPYLLQFLSPFDQATLGKLKELLQSVESHTVEMELHRGWFDDWSPKNPEHVQCVFAVRYHWDRRIPLYERLTDELGHDYYIECPHGCTAPPAHRFANADSLAGFDLKRRAEGLCEYCWTFLRPRRGTVASSRPGKISPTRRYLNWI